MNSSPGIFQKLFIKTGIMKPSVGKDRRRAKRYRVNLPVQFRILLRSRPDVSTSLFPASLFDLSELGLGLLIETMEFDGLHITKINSETSEEYLFEIHIPFGQEPILVSAKMVWYIQTADHHPFILRLGLSILDPSHELKKKIRNFINICTHANEIDA